MNITLLVYIKTSFFLQVANRIFPPPPIIFPQYNLQIWIYIKDNSVIFIYICLSCKSVFIGCLVCQTVIVYFSCLSSWCYVVFKDSHVCAHLSKLLEKEATPVPPPSHDPCRPAGSRLVARGSHPTPPRRYRPDLPVYRARPARFLLVLLQLSRKQDVR